MTKNRRDKEYLMKLGMEIEASILNDIKEIEFKCCGENGCKDGYVKVPNDSGFGWKIKYCDCLRKREAIINRIKLFDDSNIPKEMLNKYLLSKYNDEEEGLIDIITEIIQNNGQLKSWLFLYGNPGTGKTYTAISACKLANVLNKNVLYVNVPKLLDDLRPKERGEDIGKKWMSMCEKADLLILDDIGKEKPSQWVKERMYIIINERYVRMLPTIFTSNESLEKLEQSDKLEDAVVSRIKHYGVFIEMNGKDKRLK